jgi:hypothetical protein
MRNNLLVFRRLANNPKGILTAVHWLALVSIKRSLDFCLGFVLREFAGFKLGITALANADSWQWWLYDSQLTFLHDRSLAHLEGRP